MGHPWLPWGNPWSPLGHPGVILGHPEVLLGHPGVILGYPGLILGHPWVTLGHPEVTWGHQGVNWGLLGSLRGHPGSPGVTRGYPGVTHGSPGVRQITQGQIPGYSRGIRVSEREIASQSKNMLKESSGLSTFQLGRMREYGYVQKDCTYILRTIVRGPDSLTNTLLMMGVRGIGLNLCLGSSSCPTESEF